jgi:penicillin-binding protein 1A
MKRVWKWFRRLLITALVGLALFAGIGAGSWWYFSRDLPSVEELRTWRPPQVTKVYCQADALCAEYFRERRTWVDITQVPPHVKNAFLAAEDADFYKHGGMDFIGMLRAGLLALRPGKRAHGASTISQQACRNLLLSQDRTIARKIREWILTPRMEKALTKDEILNLYVNTIWFGHQRYGLEEAALFYFGKHTRNLSIGEAAVLAGTVQLPQRINPLTSIVKAKIRQRYVLGQMGEHGFVPKAVAEAEMEKPIVLGPRPPAETGAYYAEEIRQQLVARYGDKAVLEGGLRVDIAMNVKLQAAAEASVRAGLEAIDRRQGYRGALGSVEAQRFVRLRKLLQSRLDEAGRRKPDEVLIADLAPLAAAVPTVEEGADPRADPDEVADPDEPIPTDDQKLARAAPIKSLGEGVETVGYVIAVDDKKAVANVDLIGRMVQVPFSSVGWARPRSPEGKIGSAPVRISDVIKAGELVRVRIGKGTDASLAQMPSAQGALLAINPVDRTVVAMVGGYDFSISPFNRAIQAKRQPGSSFKPFLYGAAVGSGRFTTISVVNDAPEAVRDPYTGKTWKPHNYEQGGFEGPMTLRQAITKSKNTVSVRLIEALTPTTVVDFAQKAGIHSQMPDNLTLALGTGEVSMLEIANAYSTLQSLGKYAEPVMLVKVVDSKGTVLEEHHASFEETLPPAVTYLTTSLMRSVVEEGTATAVKELDRPAAGKTGTASEFRDAWFSGYTAELVASAWVGFDDHTPLGAGETGGKAALPLWLEFMKVAHQGLPTHDFEPPPGVVMARIDPVSGLLAGKSVPGRNEWFLEGTAPTAEAPPPGQVDPNEFLLHDERRR